MRATYLDGTTLASIVNDRGALPVAEAVFYVRCACEALEDARGAGVRFAAIDLASIVVERALDGSTRVRLTAPEVPRRPPVKGRRTSPSRAETAVKAQPAHAAADDIRALGAVLYHLLTGVAPSSHASSPTPPADLRPGLPLALSRLVLRCLAADPAARPSSFVHLACALRPFAGAAGHHVLIHLADDEAPPSSRVSPPSRRSIAPPSSRRRPTRDTLATWFAEGLVRRPSTSRRSPTPIAREARATPIVDDAPASIRTSPTKNLATWRDRLRRSHGRASARLRRV